MELKSSYRREAVTREPAVDGRRPFKSISASMATSHHERYMRIPNAMFSNFGPNQWRLRRLSITQATSPNVAIHPLALPTASCAFPVVLEAEGRRVLTDRFRKNAWIILNSYLLTKMFGLADCLPPPTKVNASID